MNLAKMILTV